MLSLLEVKSNNLPSSWSLSTLANICPRWLLGEANRECVGCHPAMHGGEEHKGSFDFYPCQTYILLRPSGFETIYG
jgi:hypothetical protein